MIRREPLGIQRQLDLFESEPQKTIEDPRPAFQLVTQTDQLPEHRTRYSPELVKKAVILFARGVSYKTVANSLAIPVYTAREWQHRYLNHTLEAQEGRLCKGRYPGAVKQQVIRMRVELGMSYNRIVRETGISRATIRSWLSEAENGKKSSQVGQDFIQALIE